MSRKDIAATKAKCADYSCRNREKVVRGDLVARMKNADDEILSAAEAWADARERGGVFFAEADALAAAVEARRAVRGGA